MRPLGLKLNVLVKALDDKFGSTASSLHDRWPEIVGETLASRTEPIKLTAARGNSSGVLELRVAGPFAALVQHQAQDIMARLDLVLGKGKVGRLRVVQGPISVATRKAGRPVRRLRPPLDAAIEAEIADGLSELPEGPLKQALAKLGREVMRGR
jgi:hypothetical protein